MYIICLGQEGKPDGEGVVYYQNGDVFVGNYVNGVAHGRGHYIWNNGAFY